MTADGGETLRIRDADMIEAIAAVSRQWPGPPPRRLRLPVLPILALAAAIALFAFAPRLIRAATVRLIPPEQAEEIGDRMLIALIEAHGPPCAGPDGERALGRLAAALDPSDPPRLRVMDLGAGTVAALPGADDPHRPRGTRHSYARRGCREGRQRARRRPCRGAGSRCRHPCRHPLRLQRPPRGAGGGARGRIGGRRCAHRSCRLGGSHPRAGRFRLDRPARDLRMRHEIGRSIALRSFQRCIRRMKLV